MALFSNDKEKVLKTRWNGLLRGHNSSSCRPWSLVKDFVCRLLAFFIVANFGSLEVTPLALGQQSGIPGKYLVLLQPIGKLSNLNW